MGEVKTIEDEDPLVRAVVEKFPADCIHRRPGLLKFVALLPPDMKLFVTRSRFDGNYGDISRLLLVKEGQPALKMSLAPTETVLAAVSGDKPAENLFEVYTRFNM